MPFSSLAARPREDHSARSDSAPRPRFYSTDLLPTMQGFLAAVADLETRYEIARERIELGSGSEEEKQSALAELRAFMSTVAVCIERLDRGARIEVDRLRRVLHHHEH